MNAQEQHNPTKSARGHLLASLSALASDDCAKTSRHLWLAAREAAAVAARLRDWPADGDDEIKDAIRRLDGEYGDEQKILLEFHTAEMFRDNADYGFLDKDEIIWFQPVVHELVDRLLTALPVGKTK